MVVVSIYFSIVKSVSNHQQVRGVGKVRVYLAMKAFTSISANCAPFPRSCGGEKFCVSPSSS